MARKQVKVDEQTVTEEPVNEVVETETKPKKRKKSALSLCQKAYADAD